MVRRLWEQKERQPMMSVSVEYGSSERRAFLCGAIGKTWYQRLAKRLGLAGLPGHRFSFAWGNFFSNSLCSRLFSGFDFVFAFDFVFPLLFSVSPRLRVSVVNTGFWLCLRHAVVRRFCS